MWNLPPPPGFQGLHPDKPVKIYQRHLPHWRQEGASYFVTFRLNDSLPFGKLRKLAAMRTEWERLHPPPQPTEALRQFSQEITQKCEHWLDCGYGSCILRQRQLSQFVVDSLHHFDIPSATNIPGGLPSNPSRRVNTADDETPWPRYELGCYVIMPNHVHAVVRPLSGDLQALESVIGGWKQYSATRINRDRKTNGERWQDESYDCIIRDEEHLWRVIQYIGRNPAKSKLSPESCRLWIRPEMEGIGLDV